MDYKREDISKIRGSSTVLIVGSVSRVYRTQINVAVWTGLGRSFYHCEARQKAKLPVEAENKVFRPRHMGGAG